LPPPGFETLSMVDLLRYQADHLDFCCVSTTVYLDLVLLYICRCVSAAVYLQLCICSCVSATVSTAMIPLVQQWTSPDRVRPSPVQSSPSNFWTGLRPIPNFSGPGLNWPRLLWTSPLGPNRPKYAGGYLYTESTNRLINDCSLVICKSSCTPHPSPLATCHSPLTTLIY